MQQSRPDLATAFREPGIDIKNNQERVDRMERTPMHAASRPEMSGPRNTNIDSLLSGFKPKPMQRDSDSILSMSSLKDLDGALPRRKGSGKNILSLESLDL